MASNAIVPVPKVDVSVRVATLDDVPFIDALQREHGRQLGFLALSWIENKIKAGQVIVAVDPAGGRLGYVISQDKYLKREELGLIVQLCVVKGAQRKLVGATLLKAAFERAAYGCRLFCLWCAQDIAANRFWEAMGFKALAYRAGSEKKRRVHLFWQVRVRAGDDVPWWFPSTTGAGAMRADRIVLPIPPGKHWSDEMPVIVLPGEDAPKALPAPRVARERKPKVVTPVSRRLSFAPIALPKAEKVPREKKPRLKNDPKLVAAARELRDRWLEQVNAGAYLLEDAGKYDVSRILPAATGSPVALLPAA